MIPAYRRCQIELLKFCDKHDVPWNGFTAKGHHGRKHAALRWQAAMHVYAMGYKVPDIARAMHRTQGSVYSMLSKHDIKLTKVRSNDL